MKRVQSLAIPQMLGDICNPQRLTLVVYGIQVGIEPMAVDAYLGIVPVVVEDARGSGHAEAAQRLTEAPKIAGDAVFTDMRTFCHAMKRQNG
jgi:hypothetical protein